MRKITLLAVVAVIATGFGVWAVAAPTNARIPTTSQRIEPIQLMTNAKGLAAAELVDYTFVFPH